MSFRALRWLLAAALLGGCTGLQQQAPPVNDWDQRRDGLLTIQDWSLRGRVGIKAADTGGQANLDWRQRNEVSRLRFAGPFGTGQVELTVAPERVTLNDKSGERSLTYNGPDAAERFMAEQLGWSLPVRSARYWVLGLLDPAAPGNRTFDDLGELQSIQQHGWTVVYERFTELGGEYLPAKLVIENPRLRLTLLTRSWLPDFGLTQ